MKLLHAVRQWPKELLTHSTNFNRGSVASDYESNTCSASLAAGRLLRFLRPNHEFPWRGLHCLRRNWGTHVTFTNPRKGTLCRKRNYLFPLVLNTSIDFGNRLKFRMAAGNGLVHYSTDMANGREEGRTESLSPMFLVTSQSI